MLSLEERNKQIEDAIQQLYLAKQLATEAESLKSQATTVLMPYMASSGLKKYDSRTVRGSVTYVAPGVSKKFNKEKAAQELLVGGVSADVIQSAYNAATSESARAGYVKFEATKD